MSITVGDVLKVVAVLAWTDGDIAQNVFSAVIGGAGGPYDDDDIVADAKAWLNTMYANLSGTMADTIDGSEVRVYVYDSIDDDYDEVGSDSWTFNPTGATESLPRGVAGLINCKTTDPDVSGKKYLPGFCEGNSEDNGWSSTTLSNVADFADDWVTGFTGGTSGASWVPGVWSVKNSIFYAMTGAVVIPTIPAYQRRRKQGVGI